MVCRGIKGEFEFVSDGISNSVLVCPNLCYSASRDDHENSIFRLIRVHSNARNSIFQLHHAVDNMYKTIRFILEVSAEHRDYNNTLYYNNYIHII